MHGMTRGDSAALPSAACSKCATVPRPGSRFCGRCGTPLDAPEPAHATDHAGHGLDKAKQHRRYVWAATGFVALAAAAITAGTLYGGTDSAAPATTHTTSPTPRATTTAPADTTVAGTAHSTLVSVVTPSHTRPVPTTAAPLTTIPADDPECLTHRIDTGEPASLPLRPCQANSAVHALQRVLYSTYGASDTGVYDDATFQAVQAFQLGHGLPETGLCDTATWVAITSGQVRGTDTDGDGVIMPNELG